MLQMGQAVFAANKTGSAVSIAIKKYKRGNFTGCLQDCQRIVTKNPTNSLAYYYMAMSYVQAGRKNEAIIAYTKVLSLKTSTKLYEYASTGKRCLETPEQCQLSTDPTMATSPGMDALIASPVRGDVAQSVKNDITQIRLNGIRNKINSGQEMDDYSFRKFKNYSDEKTELNDGTKIAQAKPTQEEIAAAMKVLNDAGMPQYSQNPMMPTQAENPEYLQLKALLGNGNQQQNNDIMNMIPMMMSQNNNGTANYSPQMMQAVILNSMMSDLNFNLNDNKDK